MKDRKPSEGSTLVRISTPLFNRLSLTRASEGRTIRWQVDQAVARWLKWREKRA